MSSAITADIQFLLLLAVIIGGALFLTVVGIFFYMITRFKESNPGPRQKIEKEHRLELLWTFAAIILVVFAFVVTLPTVTKIVTMPQEDSEMIWVTGLRFQWQFREEAGNTSVGVLSLDVGQLYVLNVTSVDVVHSFFVYDLSFKIDAIPGVFNLFWLKIETPGTYRVQCAEMCGDSHFNMLATIVAS
ncbi:MAG: cytochrome c oxidase subunit II [Candidatus Thorarchaeota archaeon]